MIITLSNNKARLKVNVGSGKRRKVYTKTVTYNGKKDLNRQYAEFEAEVRHSPLQNATLEDIINSYIADKKALGLAPTTIRGYNICLKRINDDLKKEKAAKILPIHIQDYIAEKQGKYSSKTIRNDIGLISASYARAIRLDLLKENPCDKVILPKQSQDEIKTLSEEQIIEFLYKLESGSMDYKVGYQLCLFCGMRRSEVLGLKESDVDFEKKCLFIHQTRHRVDGEDSVQPTKTMKSKRILALPDFILEDIRSLIAKHHNYPFRTSDYLILSTVGKPIDPSTFSCHIRYIMPGISVHGLRHTFATMLNAQGVDIARISAELGHANIHTTLSKYTHVFGNVSASSRGIADSINKYATKLQQSDNSQKQENP